MNEEQRELARQMLDTGRFEWRAGMRIMGADGRPVGRHEGGEPPSADHLPDLEDMATAGALLGLVDDLGVLADVAKEEGEWIVAIETDEGLKGWIGGTLGEATGWAFLAALEGLADGEYM